MALTSVPGASVRPFPTSFDPTYLLKAAFEGEAPSSSRLSQQGEVNWKEVFETLQHSDFSGPVSLHIEYAVLKENTKPEKERMLKIARQDLAFLKSSLRAAEMV